MALDLNDILIFCAVVEAKSFSGAARSLGKTTSSVSRRIVRLESEVGHKLLHRTTRELGLSDAGRAYYERVQHIGRDAEIAAQAVHSLQSETEGVLRVTAPPDDGGIIWAMLEGFMRAYPKVDIELIHTLSYVDLVKEGIDLALRGGSPGDSTEFSACKLCSSRLMMVASPDYLKKNGCPQSVEDLEKHSCLAMDHWVPNAIPSLRGTERGARIRLRHRLRVNTQETARRAAVVGLGIAPMIEMTCAQDIKAGKLLEVLPEIFPGPAEFWAVYPAGRKLSAAGRALLDHLRETAPRLVMGVPG